MPAVFKKHDPGIKTWTEQEAGLTLFDIKRRQGTGGSQYDARSIKGIRTKTKKRKPQDEWRITV